MFIDSIAQVEYLTNVQTFRPTIFYDYHKSRMKTLFENKLYNRWLVSKYIILQINVCVQYNNAEA